MKTALTMFPENIEWEGIQQQNFPLGIYLIASYLKHAGHEVSTLNFHEKDDIDLNHLSTYDVVGFSCDSFNYAKTCEVAREIKELNPKVRIVFGGIHVSHLPAEALANPFVDYVVRGEGELIMTRLLESDFKKERLCGIPGLSYKIGDRIEHNAPGEPIVLDSSTLLPAYEQMTIGMDYLPFETSRGCQNKCTFCSIDQSHHWRPYSEEVMFDKLEQSLSLVPDVGSLKYLSTTDDCFTTDPKRAINILRGVTRRYPFLSMRIQARIRDLLKDEELLDVIAECNVKSTQIGVECGYAEGLKNAKKAISLEQVDECARKLGEKGLTKKAYFAYMIGLPWETKKECLTTISFAEDIFQKYGVPGNIALWFPFPAKITSDYGFCRDEWYRKKGWWGDDAILLESHPNLSPGDLSEIHVSFERFIRKSNEYLGISL
jgi:anaerobic magnesium-protoporphyrin IX monomethyl ester cyclase